MARHSTTLTTFGKDLDSLLKRAGKFTIREYADECGVSYKYISQLRTVADRRPGALYVNLLRPFTRLEIIGLAESHQLSLRHRGKPLSLSECKDIFPDIPEQELVESVKQAVELKDQRDTTVGQAGTKTEADSTQMEEPGSLYRRVFVGREVELQRLQTAFDSAMLGQGSLVMVVGEPGIGKTVLCEQLSNYVTLKGGRTLVGHCYEEGSLSLPYLAFVEAMRSYVLARDTEDLRKELGTGAADVARIVTEVMDKLEVELRPPASPEEERYRLFQAVTSFLTGIAEVQPLLIVLEDLHDSDKGTLELLTHVLRNLGGARLLVVGTYRDVEVDRAHPLSAALAELRRVTAFDRVLLRGLNADEVRRMLESITRQEVPWGLADVVHRQTEGNPLFVQEVIRYLVEEGMLSRGEGQQRTTTLEMSIPEGLRDVIGKRLSGLSHECNRILAIASVIGREFRLDTLQKVAEASDDELFTVLEEARRAAVVEERSMVGAAVTYRFAHAFFRQTLYEEIIAPRRIQLHQQIGKTLEEVYAKRLGEHAAELAEHFSHSSDPVDLAKAVNYGEMAAQQAASVYAYGEAARLLEQTVKVQEVLNPDDKTKRCDLLLTTAEALIHSAEPRHVLDTELPVAFSLAEAIVDSKRASETCRLAYLAITLDEGMWGSMGTPEAAQWVERADFYALPNTVERGWANLLMGRHKSRLGQTKEGIRLITNAVESARRIDDLELFTLAAGAWIGIALAPHYQEERLHLADEVFERTRGWLSGHLPASWRGPRLLIDAFLASGQRSRAEDVIREHQEMAVRTGQINDEIVAMWHDVWLAALDGRLVGVLDIVQHIIVRSEELSMSNNPREWIPAIIPRVQLHLGHANEAFQSSEFAAETALCLAHLGQRKEVLEMLERLVMSRSKTEPEDDETPESRDILLLETAVLVEHHPAAELLIGRLARSKTHTSGMRSTTCTARHLGAAAALLGRPEEARKHYDEAISVCTDMRFRPELALTRLQLAELLLEHYPDEKAEALEHLDFAINEFREMKMQPSLERALRHKEILGA